MPASARTVEDGRRATVTAKEAHLSCSDVGT